MLAYLSVTETLALFIGLYMLAVGVRLLIDPKAYSGSVDDLFSNPVLTFLAAFAAFATGAVIVATHNIWTSPLAAVISFIGWTALVKGLMLLLAPDWFLGNFRGPIQNPRVRRGLAYIVLVTGILLVFAALV